MFSSTWGKGCTGPWRCIFAPLLQPPMAITSIHPMVLSYFELAGYRGLRGGSPACKRVQVSPLLKAQTTKIILRESFKAQKPQHPTQTVPYKHALLWGISCFVCPLSGTLLSRYQRFNFFSLGKPRKVCRAGSPPLFPHLSSG